MAMETRQFETMHNFSRASTKWEMGPSKKFIEYPANVAARRYDYDTGKLLGFSVNQEVSTLNQTSLLSYSSVNYTTTDAESIFEGKVAKRVRNEISSASAGVSYGVSSFPAHGATLEAIVEIVSSCRIMVGFRDEVVPTWEAAFSLDPVAETFTRERGASTDIITGFHKITSVGPNGGPVYHLRMTLLAQTNPGNTLAAYHYPGFEPDTFPESRESIIHYFGVQNVPFLTPPIWADGSSVTRTRDVCWISAIPADREYPRTIYAELIAESPNTTSTDYIHGGVGNIRSGATIQDRAWGAFRNGNATALVGNVVAGAEAPNAIGGQIVPNGQLVKMALSWNAERYGFTANGSADPDILTSAGIPVVDREYLQIGHVLSSNRVLNGLVKKVYVYDEYWDLAKRQQETAA